MACRSPKFGTVLTHSDYGLFVCGPEKSQKCLQSFHEICFQYGFRNGVSLWGRTRIRRREREEELPPVEEIEASPEEVELSDFPDGLGLQGISEVSLYRLLPSIEDSSEVPQVWRLRSEGSWTVGIWAKTGCGTFVSSARGENAAASMASERWQTAGREQDA